MLLKSSSIYIAGHTGLIGSACYRVLSAAGFQNLITRSHEELELSDRDAVQKFFETERPNFVILAAGKVGGIYHNLTTPATFIAENLRIQLNVMEAAQSTGVKAFVMFGSSCMYPRLCEQPMGVDKILSGKPEETSLSYAISKLAGVQLCHAFNIQYGSTFFMPVIPNSGYGPHDNFDPKTGHVLSSLIGRMHRAKLNGDDSVTLWGTGNPRREFIYSDDIAEAVVYLLSKADAQEKLPINIGCGFDYSINELAVLVAETVGFFGEIKWDNSKPDGAPRKLLNSDFLRDNGWKPKVDLKLGLSKTYDWFLKHSGD